MGFKSYRSPMEKEFGEFALRSPLNLEQYGFQSQLLIDRYTVDFALPVLRLAIEIDGHSYHSSKADRMRDAQRDRRLMALGWNVVRFTGTEIDRNPLACVRELESIVNAIVAPQGELRLCGPSSRHSEVSA